MTSFHFRPATPDDHTDLVRFIAALAQESEGVQLDLAVLGEGVRAVLRDGAKGLYWVGVYGEEPVCCLLITPEWSDWHNACYWWIQSVYITAAHRGQGLMAHMLETLSETAQQQGVRELRLYVDTQNPRAMRAYQKCGFGPGHYHMMTKSL